MLSAVPQRLSTARTLLAGVLTVVCGLALWQFKFGEPLVHASYDYLFRFTSRPVGFTNPVSVIFMDNQSLAHFDQTRGQWDRGLHAKLINRLADDGCRLVVLDTFFRQTNDLDKDMALAKAMRRLTNVVLMADQAEGQFQPGDSAMGIDSVQPVFPADLFMAAARSNSAVPFFDGFPDGIVRKHWPFPSPGPHYSLPWLTARLAGADLDEEHPRERWLRYYFPGSAWAALSYQYVEALRPGYFRDHIVFIGYQPSSSDLSETEKDKFLIPGQRSRRVAVGGVEILATAFLNLMDQDWIERPPRWLEAGVLVMTGGVLGAGLRQCRRRIAIVFAILGALAALVAGAALTQFTNYWFPWLIVAGAQAPVALMLAITARPRDLALTSTVVIPSSPSGEIVSASGEILLSVPDYEIVQPPFGKGAYGKVWLARNAVGQWQALKAVYRSKFEDAAPFEREFRGVEHFKPISRLHPGLLCIDFVSRIKPEGFFYYVMELGDSVAAEWEQNPSAYAPLDLLIFAKSRPAARIPARECVSIAIKLCDALKFLHGRGLTHRDIKPRNIILVNGEPKFADVGLVADARRPVADLTWVGTPGYMPPEPEPPGTPQADIYALGMVLYVVSTGGKPTVFPELSTTLIDRKQNPDFALLSEIIFKACHYDCAIRYASASDMLVALQALEQRLAAAAAPNQDTAR